MDPNNRHFLITGLLTVAVFLVLAVPLSVPVWAALLAGAGTFLGYGRLARPRLRIGVIERDRLASGRSDSDELAELMKDAAGDMQAIRHAAEKIENPQLRREIQRLHGTGDRILGYLNSHPSRITAARKFLGYYLDTARNVVEKYRMFEESGLETAEVKRVHEATERALPILNTAFERQFTNLMANDIMDIEADIKLLETSLKMDGD